jgi:hypothetical protein
MKSQIDTLEMRTHSVVTPQKVYLKLDKAADGHKSIASMTNLVEAGDYRPKHPSSIHAYVNMKA